MSLDLKWNHILPSAGRGREGWQRPSIFQKTQRAKYSGARRDLTAEGKETYQFLGRTLSARGWAKRAEGGEATIGLAPRASVSLAPLKTSRVGVFLGKPGRVIFQHFWCSLESRKAAGLFFTFFYTCYVRRIGEKSLISVDASGRMSGPPPFPHCGHTRGSGRAGLTCQGCRKRGLPRQHRPGAGTRGHRCILKTPGRPWGQMLCDPSRNSVTGDGKGDRTYPHHELRGCSGLCSMRTGDQDVVETSPKLTHAWALGVVLGQSWHWAGRTGLPADVPLVLLPPDKQALHGGGGGQRSVPCLSGEECLAYTSHFYIIWRQWSLLPPWISWMLGSHGSIPGLDVCHFLFPRGPREVSHLFLTLCGAGPSTPLPRAGLLVTPCVERGSVYPWPSPRLTRLKRKLTEFQLFSEGYLRCWMTSASTTQWLLQNQEHSA